MSIVEGIGFIAASLTTVGFVPQVLKTWRSRSAADLSFQMVFILLSGVTFWLVYGLMVGDRPIIIANAITLVLICLLFIFKLTFK